MFFDRIQANASFADGKLQALIVDVYPVGDHAAGQAKHMEDEFSSLIGASLPLNASDFLISGVPEYLTKAVVIAVNQAWDASLAGQQ